MALCGPLSYSRRQFIDVTKKPTPFAGWFLYAAMQTPFYAVSSNNYYIPIYISHHDDMFLSEKNVAFCTNFVTNISKIRQKEEFFCEVRDFHQATPPHMIKKSAPSRFVAGEFIRDEQYVSCCSAEALLELRSFWFYRWSTKRRDSKRPRSSIGSNRRDKICGVRWRSFEDFESVARKSPKINGCDYMSGKLSYLLKTFNTDIKNKRRTSLETLVYRPCDCHLKPSFALTFINNSTGLTVLSR